MRCFLKKSTGIVLILLLALCSLLVSCSGAHKKSLSRSLAEIQASDTLRVLTMYGPVSYFIYKDNELGYEYEMSKLLCEALGVNMQLILAPSENAMIEMLTQGKGDIIVYKLPCTSENKSQVLFTTKEYVTNQVLVQCKSDSMVKDVLDLCGKDVYVRKGSIYDMRMRDLNNEIGGGLTIKYAPDSLSSEDLIASVAMNDIERTVSSKDMAIMSRTYFSNIDYSVNVSFPQRAAWAVGKDSKELCEFVNDWYSDASKQRAFKKIYLKYFEKSKYFEASGLPKIVKRNSISQYDDLLRKYSRQIDWDWRLVAAIVYKESKFNPSTVSWAGACGLMQLMPKTARSLGIESEAEMFDPEKSIAAGTKYIKKLERIFSSINDKNERIKFTLAAYNAGPGHILDGRAFARKYGKNPDVWEGNVEPYIMLKSEPEYYTDSICKSGYCRGEETVKYVDDVLSKWEHYKQWGIPK